MGEDITAGQTAAAAPAGPAPVQREAPASNGAGTEKYKERGVFLRVFIYVFATHLFAGFIWLLFYLGGHRM
ncbi:DUF6126 family protein [Streptomyces humicola]|uniref:DUF6126 family protein n=1 Tax=Streptomyces humicola TaxID=2953240 RepID=UPI003557305C